MNRKQLEESAKQYGLVNFKPDNAEAAKRGFMAGALCSINSVWHDASEIPEANKRVLVCFENLIGEYVYYRIRLFKPNVLKNWNMGNFSLDKVLYWCYLDDLLPERKEETE